MGAAGALELAGNLGGVSGWRRASHHQCRRVDPDCDMHGLVINEPREIGKVEYILNNSFGMLGINSVVIIKKT